MAQRILIVDDEYSFLELEGIVLSRAGYEVVSADSPLKALEMIAQQIPDMIISDVEMPGMDGFQFIAKVHENPATAKIPFILMSSRRVFPQDRIRGLDLGSDDYLTKPFSAEELLSRVKAIMRRVSQAPSAQPLPQGLSPINTLTQYMDSLEKTAKHDPSVPPAASARPSPVPLTPSVPPPSFPQSSPSPPPSPVPSAPVSSNALDPFGVFKEMDQRIQKSERLAALFVNLSYFRGYNMCYGFPKGDEILKFTLDTLNSANYVVAEKQDFVEHVGADNFIILSVPGRASLLAQFIVREFEKGIRDFYTVEDRDRGFIEAKNRVRRMSAFPFVSIVIGVATNETRNLTHRGQYYQIGHEILEYAKTLGGSRYIIDRRHDTPGQP